MEKVVEVITLMVSGIMDEVHVFGGDTAGEKALDCVKKHITKHCSRDYPDVAFLGREQVLGILEEITENYSSVEILWHEVPLE